MSKARWQHLDRGPGHRAGDKESPAAREIEAGGSSEFPIPNPQAPTRPPQSAIRDPQSAIRLVEATGYFRMRDFDRCREILDGLQEEPPGFHALLGLCAGNQRDYATAARELSLAEREAPEDPTLRASRLSALLAAGELPEAPPDRQGPLGELAGAARWRAAQQTLEQGSALQAARTFSEASERFRSASAPSALGERLSACYVGQVVSYLAADQLDAAQQSFSRIRTSGDLPEAMLQFARQVYELAEATRDLDPHDRAEALAPLPALVLQARLHVRFYDGSQPVTMHWEGLPG